MRKIRQKMISIILALVMVFGVLLSCVKVTNAGVITSSSKSIVAFDTLLLYAMRTVGGGYAWGQEMVDGSGITIKSYIMDAYVDRYLIIDNNYKYIEFNSTWLNTDDKSVSSSCPVLNTASYFLILTKQALAHSGGTDDLSEEIIEIMGDSESRITFSFTLVNDSVGDFTGKAGETYYSIYTSSDGWQATNMPSGISSSVTNYVFDAEFLGLEDFSYPDVSDGNLMTAEMLEEYLEYWDCIENMMITVENSSGDVYYLVGTYDPTYEDDETNWGLIFYLVSEEAFDDYDPDPGSEDDDDDDDDNDGDFATELTYSAEYTDGTNAGGTLTSGTYIPNSKEVEDITIDYSKVGDDESYYEELKEYYESLEADVTATIESQTDEGIASTDGVAMNTDGTANSEGWYYPDTTNTKVIAKDYPFADYNNDEDNGIVSETVELVGENGGTSTENVSIKWKFRIIDVIYDENDDGSTTVTVVTNLPMDPDNIEDGWSYVGGSDNHEIRKTYDEGEDIDEDVTVYQNDTGETDETTIKIDAEEDDDDGKADEDLPYTGATITLVILLIIAAVLSVITYRKKKNIYKK